MQPVTMTTLALANETREAWVNAVAAFESGGSYRETRRHHHRLRPAERRNSLWQNRCSSTRRHKRASRPLNAEMAGQGGGGRGLCGIGLRNTADPFDGPLGARRWAYYVARCLPPRAQHSEWSPRDRTDCACNRLILEVARLGLAPQPKGYGLDAFMQPATLTRLEVIAGARDGTRGRRRRDRDQASPRQVEFRIRHPDLRSGKAAGCARQS